MTGAIIGDIVGSRFEFNNRKSKSFTLFTPECSFTDDTVMTLAVAKALNEYDRIEDYGDFKKTLIKSMHEIGNKYPDCGYGGRFYHWIREKRKEPYGSYGNGSAMRVSPAGWYASSLGEAEKIAEITAEVTHDHHEGIKGAVTVAGAIYLARTGRTMEQIKNYVRHYYTIDFTLDEIRPSYRFDETCQGSVPQALEAFFESVSFEDAIRNAVSLGGDSDTLAAIAGSVAEAFYGIPEEIRRTAEGYLDGELLSIYNEFNLKIKKETKKMENSKNNVTELVFILDRSGSMAGLEADTIGGFNAMIEKQKKEKGECLVSTVLFDNVSEVLHDRVRLTDIKPMTDREYTVRGCTALVDAIGGAIHHIGNVHKYARREDVPEHTMFVITTDGMENASNRYSAEQVKHMIERQKNKYGWEFLFIGANIDAVETARRYGINEDRAVNYNADSEGTGILYESVACAVSQVRKCAPLSNKWKESLDEDYRRRGRKK